jgi:hypothetical protein
MHFLAAGRYASSPLSDYPVSATPSYCVARAMPGTFIFSIPNVGRSSRGGHPGPRARIPRAAEPGERKAWRVGIVREGERSEAVVVQR